MASLLGSTIVLCIAASSVLGVGIPDAHAVAASGGIHVGGGGAGGTPHRGGMGSGPPSSLTAVGFEVPDLAAFRGSRWQFAVEPVPLAAVSDSGIALWIACDDGAARIGFTTGWMSSGGGGVDSWVRDWAAEGIVTSFEIAGENYDLPVELREPEDVFVAREVLPLDAPLLSALARGRSVLLHHWYGMESEQVFTLTGSGDALGAFVDNCR
ncbi:hypothetical protein [Salinarimonas chemoclinalis]|uniref:hypothetical protein n=1 Tax=Salinarimonas chemoclinalis TaxID=3241599 RepID=UPI003557D372